MHLPAIAASDTQQRAARTSSLASMGVQVFFDVNGVPRVVEVVDESVGKETAARRPTRDKADPSNIGSVPAPMSGEVVEVKAMPGGGV